jgi:hypothetical protein
METENPRDAKTFLQKTQIVLEKDEVCGNLIYGLAHNLMALPAKWWKGPCLNSPDGIGWQS